MLRPHTPVLSRGPGILQVGLDQEPALVLVGVPVGMQQVLTLLDGCHSRRTIANMSASLGVGDTQLAWTVRTLVEAGLVTEGRPFGAPSADELTRARVRLLGAGVLGKAIAELILAGRPDVLYVMDSDRADSALYPGSQPSTTQAQALSAELAGGSRGGPVRVINHWTKPDERRPDVTLIAFDRLECDRAVSDSLVRADEPHLVVRGRAGGVVVGPLVVPGLTPCLRCTDLSRRDADPAWPTLLPQLTHTRMSPAPALVGWAAGVAVAQVLCFLRGAVPETWGATLEVAPDDFVTRRRAWPMHPQCGCGWNATAQ